MTESLLHASHHGTWSLHRLTEDLASAEDRLERYHAKAGKLVREIEELQRQIKDDRPANVRGREKRAEANGGRFAHVDKAKVRLNVILNANQELKRRITDTRRSSHKTKQALLRIHRDCDTVRQRLDELHDRTSDHQQSRERIRADAMTFKSKIKALELDSRRKRTEAAKAVIARPRRLDTGAWTLEREGWGRSSQNSSVASAPETGSRGEGLPASDAQQHHTELFITQLFAKTMNTSTYQSSAGGASHSYASAAYVKSKRAEASTRKLSGDLVRIYLAVRPGTSRKPVTPRNRSDAVSDESGVESLSLEQLRALHTHIEAIMGNLNSARAAVILAEQEYEETLGKRNALAVQAQRNHADNMAQRQQARSNANQRERNLQDWAGKVESLETRIESRHELLEGCKDELLRIQNVLDPASYQHNFRQGVRTHQLRAILSALEARVHSIVDVHQNLRETELREGHLRGVSSRLSSIAGDVIE